MQRVAYIFIFNSGSNTNSSSNSSITVVLFLIYYKLWRKAGHNAIGSQDIHSMFRLKFFFFLFKFNAISNFIPNANTDCPVQDGYITCQPTACILFCPCVIYKEFMLLTKKRYLKDKRLEKALQVNVHRHHLVQRELPSEQGWPQKM